MGIFQGVSIRTETFDGRCTCGHIRYRLLPPDIHIYTASKQPWVNLPPDVPAKSGYYMTSQYWPADSLARREALRKTKTKATVEQPPSSAIIEYIRRR